MNGYRETTIWTFKTPVVFYPELSSIKRDIIGEKMPRSGAGDIRINTALNGKSKTPKTARQQCLSRVVTLTTT